MPYALKKYIKKLVDTRFLNFTIPHIPSHTAQQYITSGKGLLYLKQLNT